MKRLAIAILVASFALGTAGAHSVGAQALLVDYVGFDYEDPDPDSTQFGEAGSGYVGVGEVPGVFAPLVADLTNNEYSYYISGLTQTNTQVFGSFLVIDYTPGTLSVYEDSKASGTPLTYGADPPNGSAPSTFTDGTQILTGNLTKFRFVFNTANGTGSYEADFEATGGSQIGNIPLNQRKGWTFAGATGNSTGIPDGYYHQIDGQVFLDNAPTPAQHTSWGALKAQYR